ncbi:MAG: redoxin domain-containing protein [Acidiferrobacter sp.]
MNPLRDAINAYDADKRKTAPEQVLVTMAQCTAELKESGIGNRALKAGDTMSDFALPNQQGEVRTLSSYLATYPVVLNIYRGGWCPYCNMEMKALHDQEMEDSGRLIGRIRAGMLLLREALTDLT